MIMDHLLKIIMSVKFLIPKRQNKNGLNQNKQKRVIKKILKNHQDQLKKNIWEPNHLKRNKLQYLNNKVKKLFLMYLYIFLIREIYKFIQENDSDIQENDNSRQENDSDNLESDSASLIQIDPREYA